MSGDVVVDNTSGESIFARSCVNVLMAYLEGSGFAQDDRTGSACGTGFEFPGGEILVAYRDHREDGDERLCGRSLGR